MQPFPGVNRAPCAVECMKEIFPFVPFGGLEEAKYGAGCISTSLIEDDRITIHYTITFKSLVCSKLI